MNVLFISKLNGSLNAGPNHSVPAQIRSLSVFDNVFWYNLDFAKREEWSRDGLDCKNLCDYPSGRLADLPDPFNKPDLAVIEELYCYPFCKMIADLQKAKIPYIIIPRSQMTDQAQKKNRWKKIIGNLLYFNQMIRKAAAIQYLTKQEMLESDSRWSKRFFIIPNGAYKQTTVHDSFSKDKINATYIGRYEMYQKGLDMMVAAIGAEQEDLRANGFVLNMYGPDQENTVTELKRLLAEYEIEDIIQINTSVLGEEKRKVLLSTDVFIMTSRFEGLPMGMIEALAYGLPCIATVGTNLSEEVASFDAGWTASNDVESIRAALRALVNDRDKLAQKSQNAVKMADTYSWDAIAQKSHEIYGRIVTGR